MQYKVFYAKNRCAYFTTCDERVVWATKTLAWAFGKSFSAVQSWCEHNGIHIKLVGTDFKPPAKLSRHDHRIMELPAVQLQQQGVPDGRQTDRPGQCTTGQ